MASPIEAILLLADAATVDPLQKVHILGAGWSVASTPTSPSAVVVMAKIPWDRTNQKLPTTLTLMDADGRPVSIEGTQIGTESVLEAGRPPGVEEGTPIDAAFQLTVGPMPLAPGRYTWVLHIAEFVAQAGFQVR